METETQILDERNCEDCVEDSVQTEGGQSEKLGKGVSPSPWFTALTGDFVLHMYIVTVFAN